MEKLKFDFMNAAGWAKTVEQVERLAKVPVLTHIVAGSFTEHRRYGNTGGTNFAVRDDGTSVNSYGLPNGGAAYLKSNVRRMKEIAQAHDKFLVVSIASGETIDEYAKLAGTAYPYADIIEINVGCPNVYHGSEQKEIVSYNPHMLRRVLESVYDEVRTHPQWVKLSPYANPEERVRIAEVIKEFDYLQAVVTSNTLPNVRLRDESGKPLLDVTAGRGGMAGTALKELALANAEHFRELLPDTFDVVGVGGISNGADLIDYERARCTGMQVGTAFFHNENFRVFGDIVQQYVELADENTQT